MHKKNKKIIYNMILLCLLLLTPLRVLAYEDSIGIPLYGALLMEGFVSVHMGIFVQYPIAKMLKPYDAIPFFLKMFIGRIIFLIIFDLLITTSIAIFDFLFVFVGAFIIVPSLYYFKRKDIEFYEKKQNQKLTTGTQSIVYRCKNCNKKISINDNICKGCGKPIEGNNILVEKKTLKSTGIDFKYYKSKNKVLRERIKEEIINKNVNYKNLYNKNIIKRKNILCILFIFLTIINILGYLLFIKLETSVAIEISLLILFIYLYINENMITYIERICKENPKEKITTAIKNFTSLDNKRTISPILKWTPILIAMIIVIIYKFNKPVLIYKKVDNSYYIVKCSKTLNKNTTFKVPNKYKNKPVIGISSHSFSNTNIEKIEIMKGIRHIDEQAFYHNEKLQIISIPSTVIEIRKEAFKNNINLREVNIGYGIKNIASGAFENCYNLNIIELPKSIENIGQDAFKGCEDLDLNKDKNNYYEGDN